MTFIVANTIRRKYIKVMIQIYTKLETMINQPIRQIYILSSNAH